MQRVIEQALETTHVVEFAVRLQEKRARRLTKQDWKTRRLIIR